jgi:hypothetical protein
VSVGLCWCFWEDTGPSNLEDVILFNMQYFMNKERGSSGSIVSDYGLDDRAIEVRSPAEAKKGFFL